MQLSPSQTAAVHSPAPKLLLRAGSGSGKTSVLVARMAAKITAGADPALCIAVTFTVNAGREMAHRLAALGVPALRHCGTIHSLALSEAHKWPTWQGRRPVIIDEEAQAAMIRAELARMRLDKTVSIALVAATLAAGQACEAAKPTVSNRAYPVARAVRRAMAAAGQASMDMLLGEAVHYLPGSLGRLDALFWDEFQDTAVGDFELLTKIEADSKTVVGDTMQSIYGFRGSSPDYFRHLAYDLSWEQVTLADNYRSLPGIVAAANRLTAGNRDAITMQATRQGPETPPAVANYALESTEMGAIRDWLAQHATGSRAILCRHNALAERIRVAVADMLPPAPSVTLDPAMIRQAMEGVQTPNPSQVVWFAKYHDCLPCIRHFTDLCGTDAPEALLPAMAEALAQAEEAASYDFGGLFIGTAHAAKGLEWDHVLIAGAEQAAWPDAAENLRLFYVAITRARDSLTITCARKRPALHGRGYTDSEMSNLVAKL
jgi:DNA helicase-2/ATP-dependent DNA helicase PcrA